MRELTKIIEAVEAGDTQASEALFVVAYAELKRIAATKMASEKNGHTLQPTALVHEAYLRLLGPEGKNRDWEGRGHFFAAAAEAMRRVLIDNARRKARVKRGADFQRVTWNEENFEAGPPADELLVVDEALTKLEAQDPVLAQVVKLRYFTGMTVAETAFALGVSTRTVNRQWECARAWLYREISCAG